MAAETLEQNVAGALGRARKVGADAEHTLRRLRRERVSVPAWPGDAVGGQRGEEAGV